ncbi:uncharacterized protein TNCV_972611 [Trichonephila clavipes]|nr:uncharacterized protein TNCV_972611 [Trichonephila clavipes]
MVLSEEWPSYSPDLNHMVNYSVRSIFESTVCTKPKKTLDSLKQTILREWGRLKVEDLRPMFENFCMRLRLCIVSNGGLFEHN